MRDIATSRDPDDELLEGSGSHDAEADVERLHRSILRESRDPEEGRERVPAWVWMIALGVWFWAGWYLGRTGGTFDTATHLAYERFGRDATVTAVTGDAAQIATDDPLERGRQVYVQNCQSCHQADGRGLAATFPPLVGSEWVTGSPSPVIRILLNGLEGPVQVAGATYNGRMPAWRTSLTDEEIAAVATYIRQWRPNAAGAIDASNVTALREATANRTTAWTAAELERQE